MYICIYALGLHCRFMLPKIVATIIYHIHKRPKSQPEDGRQKTPNSKCSHCVYKKYNNNKKNNKNQKNKNTKGNKDMSAHM